MYSSSSKLVIWTYAFQLTQGMGKKHFSYIFDMLDHFFPEVLLYQSVLDLLGKLKLNHWNLKKNGNISELPLVVWSIILQNDVNNFKV